MKRHTIINIEETEIGNEIVKHVKQHACRDEDDANMASLKTIMRPILVAMSICGCYNFHDLPNGESENSRNGQVKRALSGLYRVTFLIILITFLTKFLAAFFYINKDFLLYNGLITSWVGLDICMFLINLKATSKTYGNQESAFRFWNDKIIPELREIGIAYPVKIVKRRCVVLLVIESVLILVNMAGVGVQLSVAIRHGTDSFYTAPLASNWFTLTLFFLFESILSTVWIFPVFHAITTSAVLTHAFKVLNTHMHETFEKESCRIPADFQKTRLLHLNLSKLVNKFDGDFGLFYANLFVWNIAIACFTLYQIIRTSMDVFTLIMFSFWLISGLAMIGSVSIFAAFGNDAAHFPLHYIYYINVCDVTMEKVAELNLFLSKLTGTQVGFTTCGLLTITKEFSLTIAGVFLTYFAVLYTL